MIDDIYEILYIRQPYLALHRTYRGYVAYILRIGYTTRLVTYLIDVIQYYSTCIHHHSYVIHSEPALRQLEKKESQKRNWLIPLYVYCTSKPSP